LNKYVKNKVKDEELPVKIFKSIYRLIIILISLLSNFWRFSHLSENMFIDEVILDGFKSYATRTTIGKFDPKFNAITGLNGSGKSNILDAICFVLGIAMDKVFLEYV
jgi:hypothetical protein